MSNPLASKVGGGLVKVNWLNVLSLLYGALFVTEFCTLWLNKTFTTIGLQKRLLELSEQASLDYMSDLLAYTASYADIIAPISLIVIGATTLMLMLFIYRTMAMYLAAIILTIYSVFHLSTESTWLFQYILPAMLAFCIAFVGTGISRKVPHDLGPLGYKIFIHTPIIVRIGLIIIFSGVLYATTYMAENVLDKQFENALLSTVLFAALFSVSLLLDKKRAALTGIAILNEIRQRESYWIDIMAIVIGAMLVFQIYENTFLNWFTVKGHKDLILTYHTYTNAIGVKDGLLFAAKYSDVILPVQMALEGIFALLMVIQIYRAQVIWFVFAFLFALMYIEFGVPATWPVTAVSETTWQWELMLVTAVTGIIGLEQTGRYLIAGNNRERYLGPPIFRNNSGMLKRFFIALVSGLSLSVLVVLANEVAKVNHILAIASGLTLFLYILILACIDLERGTTNST